MMKKILGLLCISLVVSFSSLKVSAQNTNENFQFLVKAEKGLQLTIMGFGSAGEKTFQASATKRVNYKGKTYYGILVDEDVVFASFAFWCVQDASKKWLLPAKYGKEPDEVLCDRQPRDDGKGTYVFKVR
jgi:hypothetical protein